MKLNKDFDKKKQIDFFGIEVIEYGIISGNNTIIFAKSGQDGSIYGYKNKYLNLAINLNKKYGVSVICSSNPFIKLSNSSMGLNPLDHDIKIIDEYAKESEFVDYQIYYMGVSNGALIGCVYGINYPRIKKLLLINPPLVNTIGKVMIGIQKFNGEKMTFVFGTLDESYPFVNIIKCFQSNKIKFEIFKGQDHYFSKNNFCLEELPEKFLLN